jgi:hypothetical protein
MGLSGIKKFDLTNNSLKNQRQKEFFLWREFEDRFSEKNIWGYTLARRFINNLLL